MLRLQDIQRLARLGIIASMQPTHATSDMPWAGDRLGARRLAGAYAWRKVLDAGGRLALGSDFPVESRRPPPRPLRRRHPPGPPGEPAGGLAAGRAADPRGGPARLHPRRRLVALPRPGGRLAGGRQAGRPGGLRRSDPMTVPEREIPRAAIDYTLVDGQVVYERGRGGAAGDLAGPPGPPPPRAEHRGRSRGARRPRPALRHRRRRRRLRGAPPRHGRAAGAAARHRRIRRWWRPWSRCRATCSCPTR